MPQRRTTWLRRLMQTFWVASATYLLAYMVASVLSIRLTLWLDQWLLAMSVMAGTGYMLFRQRRSNPEHQDARRGFTVDPPRSS